MIPGTKMKISSIVRKVASFFKTEKKKYIMTTITVDGDFVKAFIECYSNGTAHPIYQFTDKKKAVDTYEYLTFVS